MFHELNLVSKYCPPLFKPNFRSLLRHGILIWIDIPLDMIAKEAVEDGLHLPEVELLPSASYPEVSCISLPENLAETII